MNHGAKCCLIAVLLVAVWAAGPAGTLRAQENAPGVTKLFEETSYYLKDVTFVDTTTGWAVGDVHWDPAQQRYVGTIITTTDGGVTWTPQATGVTALLNAVTFIDATTGWVVGDHGTILHTRDGGESWVPQTIDIADEFRSVAFADADHGWAVTTLPTTYDDFFDEYTDWDAAVWHTSDGGSTWEQQSVPPDASILHGVDCADAMTAWAVGVTRAGEDTFGRLEHAAVIYSTADGGQTWTEQLRVADLTLTAVEFIDTQHGWAIGFPTSSGADQRAVFHTQDGGHTWERQEPGDIYAPLWDVKFIDQNQGYIVGANYVAAWGPPVYRTFDGGATWENIRMDKANPLTTEGLYGVAVAGDRVVAVGDHDFFATTDRAWASPETDESGMPCYDLDCLFDQRYLNPHFIFHSVYFVDDSEGWVVGSKTFDVTHWGQVILHTTDGGRTWQTQYEHSAAIDDLGGGLFSVHRLADVYFANAQTGWAVGSSETFYDNGWYHESAIVRTTDGGETWEILDRGLHGDHGREFFAGEMIDGQNGWALAASYFPSHNVHLLHTTDGGTSGEWVDTGVEGSLAIGFAYVQGDVDFTNAQHGWAVGGLGMIVHTSDGGNTWEKQEPLCDWPSCPIRLFSVVMIDNQTGWIGGEQLYHTTNGGAEWIMQDMELPGDIRAMQFLDAQHGWVAGDGGLLMYTADGGMSWQAVETREGVVLNGLYFVDDTRGWIVGEYGVILAVENR